MPISVGLGPRARPEGKHKVEKVEHKDMSGNRESTGKKKDDCGNMKK